jgi:hypothetical protein
MADLHVALKDGNSVASAIFESSTSPGTILRGQIDPITGRILVETSGGSGSFSQFVLTATGAVNGLNTIFSFTSAPEIVVSDGVWYFPTDNNGNTQWTGTTTVTMVMPPQTAIFGIM